MGRKIASRFDDFDWGCCVIKSCRNVPSGTDGHCKDHALEYKLFQGLMSGSPTAVYAIKTVEPNSSVKIGISIDPEVRLATLLTGSPTELELLGAVPGSTTLEKLLHNLLSDYHIRGEWFRYEGDAAPVADAIATNDLDKLSESIDNLI